MGAENSVGWIVYIPDVVFPPTRKSKQDSAGVALDPLPPKAGMS